jgi:mitochondrial chaperone BCS1
MSDLAPQSPNAAKYPLVHDLFESNPYFSAGFGLIGLGAGLAVARRGFLELVRLVQRQLLVTLEIPSHDHSHAWFLHWMARHQSKNAGAFSRSHHLAVETTYKQHENGSATAAFDLVPGPGRHFIRWRGAWIQVKSEPLSILPVLTVHF